ncbi:tetratricopeptide repeat protein [Candidatus Bipolaricaulota bacterium]|nr:tetratricopeptide repeat protein [Candidatus Bipolaricaulota bacterium]
MNKNKFPLFPVIFLLILISTPAQLTEAEIPRNKIDRLVEKGREAAEKSRFKTRTEQQLKKALNVYKRVLEIDPDNTHSLTRLSSGYYMLAEAYLGYEDRKEAYKKGLITE